MLLRILGLIGLILVSPACASGGQQVEVRLVVGDKAKAQLKEDELDLFMPRFIECENCTEVTFSPPSGGSYTVEAEPEPCLVLADSDIEEVNLAETRSPLDPSVRSWMALAVPTEEVRLRMAEITEAYPFDSVLVSLSGTPVDVHSIATWSRGIRLGVFRERDDLAKFAESLQPRTVWIEFDEEEFEKARKELSGTLKSVIIPEE